MKKLITLLALSACANAMAFSVKPEHIRSMTYGQCKADPTVRFVAGHYKQQYPSAKMDQILHILCKDAR